METTLSGFTFFSNFDSGNLQKVEIEEKDPDDDVTDDVEASPRRERRSSIKEHRRKSGGRRQKRDQGSSVSPPLSSTDFAFKIWTRPDCSGTEFENGNRTWFFFGVRASSPQVNFGPGKVLKFSVMNLNKQSKLFSQGMTPIMLVLPQNGQVPSYHSLPNGGWERIRERPSFYTGCSSEEGGGGNFIMSFRILLEPNSTVYLAFTYPYSYKDLQNFLNRLEKKHGGLAEKGAEVLSKMSPTSLYFHRENVCYSLEKRRIDLLTVTSLSGVMSEREEKLDKLFPDCEVAGGDKGKSVPRPHKFSPSKKTIFVSARVHPGETQSSFVMNGFLRFLLRENDPRSMALRKKYVFKLIPMLNPDGVVNGHYRTDLRGVNLNRVYARPNFELHPQIYAARKLLLYAHHRNEVFEDSNEDEPDKKLVSKKSGDKDPDPSKESDAKFETGPTSASDLSFRSFQPILKPEPGATAEIRSSPSNESIHSSKTVYSGSIPFNVAASTPKSFLAISHLGYEMTETSRCSEGDESIADFSERHGIGVAPSPQRNLFPHLPVGPVGPISFAAAFGQSGSRPELSSTFSPARRRRLSFGREDFLSSAKKSTTNFVEEFLEPKSDLEDLEDDNKNVLGAPEEPDNPTLVAQEENANLDFVGKFIRPKSTSFIIPAHDYKAKIDVSEKDSGQADIDGGQSSDPNNDPGSSKREAPPWDPKTSGLFLYVDIHGHASKRGIFMYGNYFNDVETQASCMLLPKLMSINCANFDFPACNFTERNMYLKDRHTGAGREGSGRVSVYKSTGLINSFTLECNFNTGRVVNGIPMASRDAGRATPPPPPHPLPQTHPSTGSTPNTTLQDQVPPKYNPEIYEDAGKALATSILDLTESNPWTRLTCSACKNLRGVREWLRKYIRAAKAAEAELATEGRGRSGRRRSTNSESSIRSGQHSKQSPIKPDVSSPIRSLRSSMRRVRTLSASASVLKSSKKSPISPASYQPLNKITRKTIAQASSAVKNLDFSSDASGSQSSKWSQFLKSNSAPSPTLSTGKNVLTTPKKRLGSAKRKSSSKNRSLSKGKAKSASQSSRPNSPLRRSRPSSPRGSGSPGSPTCSPSVLRRSTSIASTKRPRSRPSSPVSRSAGPSSPRPARSNSSASQSGRKSGLKRLTPKKVKKNLSGARRGSVQKSTQNPLDDGNLRQEETESATDRDDNVAVGVGAEAGSPKSTPKKKLKVQTAKKKKKSKSRQQRAKIIISAASGFMPSTF